MQRIGYQYEIIPSKSYPAWAHIARCADIVMNDEIIGYISELNPRISSKFDITKRAGLFEINFSKLYKNLPLIDQYEPVSKYPSVLIDISVILGEKVLSSQVEEVIRSTGKNLVKSIKLFDVYQGKNIDKDKKSLAYHIEFGSDEKTLSMEEAEKIRDKICNALESQLKGKVRK